MAYGSFDLNKIQMGRESTAGTGVAATFIWRGPFANIEDARTKKVIEEQVGVLMLAERTRTLAYLARLTMPETAATFEQLPHILEAGVMTATPGATPDYLRSYIFPTDGTVPTIKTYTIEAYNTVATADYREMHYGYVSEFTLSGRAGEEWKVAATWQGREVATGTATPALDLDDVEEILFPKSKLYINASGGTIGTTQKTGVLMGFEMRVRTGVIPVPVGDGSLYFVATKNVRPEITFSLTLELEQESSNSVVATERAAFEGDDVRLLRVDVAGSGATKNLQIDWAAVYDSVGQYTNTDGNTTVTLEGHAVFSDADSLFWECAIKNGITAL